MKENYHSPDWIEITGYHTGAMHSVLMTDGVSLLVFAGTLQFTMKNDEIVNPISFANPTPYVNYYSSVVKRVLNDNIVIACGTKHITMFKEDGTSVSTYTGQGTYSHAIQCSFIEISLNKYLFAYYNEENMKNTIEILKYDPLTNTIINIKLYQSIGYNTMIICDTFKNASLILCIYNTGTIIKGQLYYMSLQPLGPEISNLLPQHSYYQIYQTNNKTLLLFGTLKSTLAVQIITYDSSLIVNSPKNIFNFNAALGFIFTHINIIPIKEQTLMLAIRTQNEFFLHKITYDIERIGFELLYSTPFNIEHLSFGVYDSFNFVFFGTFTGGRNYMFFIGELICNDVDMFINMKQQIELKGLPSNYGEMDKKSMIVLGKNPVNIPETPVISTLNPMPINTFSFSINKLGRFVYRYFLIMGAWNLNSPQCTMSITVCFDSCLECSKTIPGTFTVNQCTKCQDGFFFDATTPTNCGLGCDPNINYHYYYNENKILQCLPTPECPPEYHFKVGDTFECEADCSNHNMVGDKTTSHCVVACPPNTFYNIIANTCDEIVVCVPPEFISLNQQGCVTKEELEKEMDDILNNLDDDILYLEEYYDNITVGNSTIEIIDPSDPNRTPSKNISTIDLGECEKILLKAYEIYPPDKLIIFKKDTANPNGLTNIVEYIIYSSKGERLNVSLCDKDPPILEIPINNPDSKEYQQAKDLADKGIDIFNPQDPFFTSICFPYGSEDNMDIPRTIRIKEFLQDNSTLCPPGAIIQDINFTNDKVICSSIKTSSPTEEEEQIPSDNPLNSMKDSAINSLTNGNWEVFLCYQHVFTKNIFISGNIGNYFIMSIVSILLVDTIVFFITRTTQIQSYLFQLNQLIVHKTRLPIDNKVDVLRIHSLLKVSSYNKNKQEGEQYNGEEQNTTVKIGVTLRHSSKRVLVTKKDEVKNNKVIICKSSNDLKAMKRPGEKKTTTETSLIDEIEKGTNKNNHKVIRRTERKLTLDDYNDMEFDDLFVKDYRKFHQHYWDYLQLTHPFINTFFTKSRKVLRTIKIALFFVGIAIDFTLNAFFYSDQYMAKNYLNQGKDTFWYNIPITVYTYILGSVINITLKLLSNSESGITTIEKAKTPLEVSTLSKSFTRCYTIRLSFFIFLELLIISIFWYYTSAFCSVYPNSQLIWFKNGAISFAMSQGFPLLFCLIYTCLIQAALKYKKRWCHRLINLFLLFI